MDTFTNFLTHLWWSLQSIDSTVWFLILSAAISPFVQQIIKWKQDWKGFKGRLRFLNGIIAFVVTFIGFFPVHGTPVSASSLAMFGVLGSAFAYLSTGFYRVYNSVAFKHAEKIYSAAQAELKRQEAATAPMTPIVPSTPTS